jgi:hypothetical protein
VIPLTTPARVQNNATERRPSPSRERRIRHLGSARRTANPLLGGMRHAAKRWTPKAIVIVRGQTKSTDLARALWDGLLPSAFMNGAT